MFLETHNLIFFGQIGVLYGAGPNLTPEGRSVHAVFDHGIVSL